MTCAACRSEHCSHPDPVYAGIHPLPAAPVLPTAGSCDPTGGASLPCAAGELVDQRASNRDADGARCGGEVIAVHTDRGAR